MIAFHFTHCLYDHTANNRPVLSDLLDLFTVSGSHLRNKYNRSVKKFLLASRVTRPSHFSSFRCSVLTGEF